MLNEARKVESESVDYVEFATGGQPRSTAQPAGTGVTVQTTLPQCPMRNGTTWERARTNARRGPDAEERSHLFSCHAARITNASRTRARGASPRSGRRSGELRLALDLARAAPAALEGASIASGSSDGASSGTNGAWCAGSAIGLNSRAVSLLDGRRSPAAADRGARRRGEAGRRGQRPTGGARRSRRRCGRGARRRPCRRPDRRR